MLTIYLGCVSGLIDLKRKPFILPPLRKGIESTYSFPTLVYPSSDLTSHANLRSSRLNPCLGFVIYASTLSQAGTSPKPRVSISSLLKPRVVFRYFLTAFAIVPALFCKFHLKYASSFSSNLWLVLFTSYGVTEPFLGSEIPRRSAANI